MAKFALECPHCGTVNKASTFIFAKKEITCASCKQIINVANNRTAIGECPKCGSVAFDRSKGICPICKSAIHVVEGKANSVEELKRASIKPHFECPQCGCYIQAVEGTGKQLSCPVCDRKFDGYEEIFTEIQRAKLVSEKGISVIKYEGNNDTFVWKHPIEDFNYGSQLVVHEAQEAIFFMNGQALDLFGPGRYSLETESMPIMSKLYNPSAGRQSLFHAEVYFINKTVQMGLKWGTDSRVRFIDPETQIPLDIGASGEMNLQVSDSRKLLIKLVGGMSGIAWDDKDSANLTKSLRNCFRPLILTTVKAHLASVIESENIDILNFDKHLVKLSAELGSRITIGFEEYGLEIANFYVANLSLPDDKDQNFKLFRELHTFGGQKLKTQREAELARLEAEKNRIVAQGQADVKIIGGSADIELERRQGFAEAEVMERKGYNQKDEFQKDIQLQYAESMGQLGANMGAGGGGGGGGMMSDVLGLGIGLSVAQTMGGQINNVMSNMNPGNTVEPIQGGTLLGGWDCECGNKGISDKFCSKCGRAKPDSWDCGCGKKEIVGKFCPECGASRPESWDCGCGKKGIIGKFCPECGKPKAEASDSWDCVCGRKGITGKFCTDCGKTKDDIKPAEGWDCVCGRKGITGKFCTDCGKTKEDIEE